MPENIDKKAHLGGNMPFSADKKKKRKKIKVKKTDPLKEEKKRKKAEKKKAEKHKKALVREKRKRNKIKNKLTPEQLHNLKEYRSVSLKTTLYSLLLMIIISVLFLSAYFGLFYSSLASSGKGPGGSGTIYYMDLPNRYNTYENGKVTDPDYTEYKVKKNKMIFRGEEYINMYDIADYCGLSIIGTLNDVEFVFPNESRDTFEIIPAANIVYVNGISASVTARSVSPNELYIPVSFLSENLYGIYFTVSEDGDTITIDRDCEMLDEETPEGDSYAFLDTGTYLTRSKPIEPLNENDYFTEEEIASAIASTDASAGYVYDEYGYYDQYGNYYYYNTTW